MLRPLLKESEEETWRELSPSGSEVVEDWSYYMKCYSSEVVMMWSEEMAYVDKEQHDKGVKVWEGEVVPEWSGVGNEGMQWCRSALVKMVQWGGSEAKGWTSAIVIQWSGGEKNQQQIIIGNLSNWKSH